MKWFVVIVLLVVIMASFAAVFSRKNALLLETNQASFGKPTDPPLDRGKRSSFVSKRYGFEFDYSSVFFMSCGVQDLCTFSYPQNADINTVNSTNGEYVFRITPFRSSEPSYQSYKKLSDEGKRFMTELPDKTINGFTIARRISKDGLNYNVYIYNQTIGVLFSGKGINHTYLDDVVKTFKVIQD